MFYTAPEIPTPIPRGVGHPPPNRPDARSVSTLDSELARRGEGGTTNPPRFILRTWECSGDRSRFTFSSEDCLEECENRPAAGLLGESADLAVDGSASDPVKKQNLKVEI